MTKEQILAERARLDAELAAFEEKERQDKLVQDRKFHLEQELEMLEKRRTELHEALGLVKCVKAPVEDIQPAPVDASVEDVPTKPKRFFH